MKKGDTVKTLADLMAVAAPNNKWLNTDNSLLFSRLMVILKKRG